MKNSAPKTIILLTHAFPYGTNEAFLENEIGYLTNHFDKVFVLTKNDSPGEIRYSSSNFFSQHRPLKSSMFEQFISIILFLKNFRKSVGFFKSGIAELKERGKFTALGCYVLFHDLMKALLLSMDLSKIISKNKLTGELWLYSYWLDSSALALLFVQPNNQNVIRFSRVHGADLHEERSSRKILTYRIILAKGLHRIYPISIDGVTALRKTIRLSFNNKIELSRLGTRKPSRYPIREPNGVFVIVSCSFLFEVKRIHLIIEALSLLDLRYKWIHFGDGHLRESLEKLAAKKLPKNNYEFRGPMRNEQILEFYEKNFVDLFINTSSSEGIPVSIMEAKSFCIPCIATDAGGNREIVDVSSGLLLPVDVLPQEITKTIRYVLTLPENQVAELRRNAFEKWSLAFNAEVNYPDFIKKIEDLRL